MDREVVLLDGVDDLDLLSALGKDVSCVAYLSTHLCIERSALEHELVHGLVLRLHCAVACELDSFKFCGIVSEELDVVAMSELNPVARFDCSGVARPVLLLLEFHLESFDVDCISLLRSNEFGKVDREAECVVKHECVLA